MVDAKFIRNVYNDSVYPVILTFDVLVYSNTEHLYIISKEAIVLDTNKEPFHISGSFRIIEKDELTEEDIVSLSRYFKTKGYYRTSRVVKKSTKSALKSINTKSILLNRGKQIPSSLLGNKWITIKRKRLIELNMKTNPEKLIKYYNLR